MKIFENGLDDLTAVISETVSFMFDGAEEIGSSDISCCVLSVLRCYYENPKEATHLEFELIRNGVRNSING